MTRQRRQLLIAVQILVSFGLLAYLFWRLRDDENPFSFFIDVFRDPADGAASAVWLFTGALLILASFVLATFRWRHATRLLGIETTFRKLFAHFTAGQFISNFLPTTFGGDILRVTRLGQTTADPPRSFSSVIMDRLGGWIALPIICLVGLGWNSGLRELGFPTQFAFITALVTLAVLAAVVYLLSHDRIGARLQNRQGALRYFHALHLGFDHLKTNPREALWWVGASLIYQFSLVLALACAAEAFGIEQIGLTSMMAFLPVVLTIQSLPISIGGLGVREGLFVFFFTQLGVSDPEATLLGLFLGAMTLFFSLIGVGPLMFGGGGWRGGRRGKVGGGDVGKEDETDEMEDGSENRQEDGTESRTAAGTADKIEEGIENGSVQPGSVENGVLEDGIEDGRMNGATPEDESELQVPRAKVQP